MSQVSVFDVESNNPQIPTQFDADSGSAVPVANTLNILGNVVAAGALPVGVTKAVFTTGSGNTITTKVQISSAQAASNQINLGLSSFDSSQFTVDANGFVQLVAGGSTVTSLGVDTSTPPGTDPVTPSAGVIDVTGGQIASGTTANVIRTNSTVANQLKIEIQRSNASVGSSAAVNGVSHFNSAQFTVDANGFVGLKGSSTNPGILGVHPNATSGTGTDPTVADGSGNISILGGTVAAGTNPVRTVATAVNSLTTQVQISQALAATDATKIGLSNFNSAQFTVDANGFVSLAGGGLAIDSIAVQATTAPGVSPVVPTAAGLITVNGAAVANHSVVLESRSRAANAYNLEVQYATTAAATDATKSGVAHFDSAAFTVDANGFVQLAGGGLAIDSIGVDATSGGGTNPVLPTAAGLVTVNGARVAAGTNPIRTVSTAANVYQIQVQTSQALAATDATKVGLANFDSSKFTVDANGFVSTSGTGIGQTITGDSGGALSPTAGNWNILGGPGVTTSGSGSTLTINSVVFTDQGGSTSVTSDSGSFATAAITLTLPATPAQGELVHFVCTTASALIVDAPSTHLIRIGVLVSSAGGTATSTAIGDSLSLRYRAADTTWYAVAAPVGTWLIA